MLSVQKDAEGVMSHFAASTVMLILPPPLQYITGNNSPGKEGVEEWFSTFDGPIGYEVRDLNIATGDDVAFCHSLNRMSGNKNDGQRMDMWVRETPIWGTVSGRS